MEDGVLLMFGWGMQYSHSPIPTEGFLGVRQPCNMAAGYESPLSDVVGIWFNQYQNYNYFGSPKCSNHLFPQGHWACN